MEMTTRMIMLQNIEKMVKEQDRVDEEDSYIKQDNEDLKYLEGRYEQLQLPHTVKRVIDDYIACMQTRDERYSDLSGRSAGYHQSAEGAWNAQRHCCCDNRNFVKLKQEKSYCKCGCARSRKLLGSHIAITLFWLLDKYLFHI